MDIMVFGDDEDTDGLSNLIDQGLDGFGGFVYRDGVLMAEKVPLTEIAAAIDTPCYVYSWKTLMASFQRLQDALMLACHGQSNTARLCYAVKANSNQAILTALAQQGAGADVVSLGELERALAAGISGDRIVFSGVGKSDAEIRRALMVGIAQINVESEPELHRISAIAAEMGVLAPIGVRVNPDIEVDTHAKITTGQKGHKFGIDIDRAPDFYRLAATLPGLKIQGIAVHIGSQLVDLAPFRIAYEKIADMVRILRADGHNITHVDLGGGIGVRYRHETVISLIDYAEMIAGIFTGMGVDLTIEPGRAVVGASGVLLSRVLYVKEEGDKKFVIVDAGMNDLMRPALYDAWHDIVPVAQGAPNTVMTPVDIVGPVCETGDTFAVDRPMQIPALGDLVVFGTAGAYGAVMASNYNSRPMLAEVLVKEDEFFVIRPRQKIEDLIGADQVPAWIAPS